MADERNWTSFNAGKMFYHIDRWKSIVPGRPCPPPALITVDPSNTCNLACEWCNAWKVRKNMRQLSRQALINAADFFASWKSSDKKYGVGAVCIAGGGEPLTTSNQPRSATDYCLTVFLNPCFIMNTLLFPLMPEPPKLSINIKACRRIQKHLIKLSAT